MDEVPNDVVRAEIEQLERRLERIGDREDASAVVARLELLQTALQPDFSNSYHDHSCYVLEIPTVTRHSVLVPLAQVPGYAEPCGHCSPPRPSALPSSIVGRQPPQPGSTDRPAKPEAEAVVVEVGATVHVRREDDGALQVWTIVSGASDPKLGKVSAATPLAKALLGHAVGDVVTVSVGSVRRYTVEDIDPAPAKAAAAPPPIPESPRPIRIDAEIASFGPGQDAGYEDWVARNPGGYVLKRRDTVEEGYMLHMADCSHLELTPGSFTMRTGNPRHCSRSRGALVQWCLAETGSQPHKCSSCF